MSNEVRVIVDAPQAGQRLDLFVSTGGALGVVSRSRVLRLLKEGHILVNGQPKKGGYRLQSGDVVTAVMPPCEPCLLAPEDVPFDVLHEDADVIVISKPPGVVVHPAAGHATGTLVHGLLHHCCDLSGISGIQRPGIVHRLDKDTSGVMVVAKNDRVHQCLIEQFKDRQIEKMYLALLAGQLAEASGRIALPIGRHPIDRKKMAVRQEGGREAVTRWRARETFSRFTLVEVVLETGRTHQIRVHMAAIGHPVAGDSLYGNSRRPVPPDLARQFLHSHVLGLVQPTTGERLRFVAPLWPDLEAVLAALRREAVNRQ